MIPTPSQSFPGERRQVGGPAEGQVVIAKLERAVLKDASMGRTLDFPSVPEFLPDQVIFFFLSE